MAELFPISSLGHSVLIPAWVGGSWARDLNVSSPESPYLAFIVGLHVATAMALIIYFWRDWVRIVRGLVDQHRPARGARLPTSGWPGCSSSPRSRSAWSGCSANTSFRIHLGKPVPAAIFLTINGLILLGAEHVAPRAIRPRRH